MNDKKCVLDVHKYKPLISWKKLYPKNVFRIYTRIHIHTHKKNKYINNIKLLCRQIYLQMNNYFNNLILRNKINYNKLITFISNMIKKIKSILHTFNKRKKTLPNLQGSH